MNPEWLTLPGPRPGPGAGGDHPSQWRYVHPAITATNFGRLSIRSQPTG